MSIISTISNLSLSTSIGSKVLIENSNYSSVSNYTINETSSKFTEFFTKSYNKTKDGFEKLKN
ncbi:hypothetical protein RB653_000527 [Dictyostelium firmibasis]|uniref:Uncharacterized protein n=1 Tax=Dictyostelium firmibasis TaxID=79012 RepID=A0AAN7YXY9_9MYCE